MMIKANVNGKKVLLTVKKEYNNGLGLVYECVNENGVWVAVEESDVTEVITGIKTRFDYEGGEQRVVWVKITGKNEQEVENALEVLARVAAVKGYTLSYCSNAEVTSNGKWVMNESVGVENKDDAQAFKKNVYEVFKAAVK